MQKGKYGIPYSLYGIIAFILVILNQTLILLLLSLFVVLAEQDNQTSRTVLEALSLQFCVNFIYLVIWFVASIGVVIPFLTVLIVSAAGIINTVVSIVATGIGILGLIKAAKDEELNFPILSNMADNLLMFINRF